MPETCMVRCQISLGIARRVHNARLFRPDRVKPPNLDSAMCASYVALGRNAQLLRPIDRHFRPSELLIPSM